MRARWWDSGHTQKGERGGRSQRHNVHWPSKSHPTEGPRSPVWPSAHTRHSLGFHLLLLVLELGLSHFMFGECEGQFDAAVTLVNLKVESEEYRDDVCERQQRADEDQLALGRRL